MATRYRRDFLVSRAGGRCEYCLFPEAHLSLGLHVDHIIARQHRGSDDESNLAMACAHCNAAKGPNLASIDPESQQIVPLFNPRTDRWDEHFAVSGDFLRGLTPVGRATAALLEFNIPANVQLRQLLRRLGVEFSSRR